MNVSDREAIGSTENVDLIAIERALLTEYGVAGARVTAVHAPGAGEARLIAQIVPDKKVWPGAHAEAAFLEANPSALLSLPNGIEVAYLNRAEAEFMYTELFEDRVYEKFGVVLNSESCIVDVGANIGLFCLFAMTRCANPRLVAIEPVPACSNILGLNLKRYGANARVHAVALSDHAGTAQFRYFPCATMMSGRYPGTDEAATMTRYLENKYGKADPTDVSGQVAMRGLVSEMLEYSDIHCRLDTLSNVIQREGLEYVDLLKIDVEKSEADVLNGIRDEHWPLIGQIVMEVHDSEGRLHRIKDLLHRHGYSCIVSQADLLRGTSLYNLYAIHESRRTSLVDPAEVGSSRGHITSQRDLLIRQLRRSLPQKLPSHMIPKDIRFSSELPPAKPHG